MVNLLKTFSVEQTILFTVMLALSIKGVIDFIDWVKSKNSKQFKKDYKNMEEAKLTKEKYKELETKLDNYHEHAESLDRKLTTITATMDENFKIINAALMHDIKQWIIDQHKFYIDQGWISIVQLDMVEARYKDYVALGGNSIVPTLMRELRELPKHK